MGDFYGRSNSDPNLNDVELREIAYEIKQLVGLIYISRIQTPEQIAGLARLADAKFKILGVPRVFDLDKDELNHADLFKLNQYLKAPNAHLSHRRTLTEPEDDFSSRNSTGAARHLSPGPRPPYDHWQRYVNDTAPTYDSELASMLPQSFDRGTRTGNDGAALRPWLDVDGHST